MTSEAVRPCVTNSCEYLNTRFSDISQEEKAKFVHQCTTGLLSRFVKTKDPSFADSDCAVAFLDAHIDVLGLDRNRGGEDAS